MRVLAQGTGQALRQRRGATPIWCWCTTPRPRRNSSPRATASSRRQIAWNDFIVVGPRERPRAHRRQPRRGRGVRTIAAQAPFVSRGDKSGTDALEKRLWWAAEIDPAKAAGAWYRDIGGGMGAALNAAAAMDAYTLSDRGTWLGFGNKRDLAIAFEGDPRLLNRYDVIELDPKRHPADARRGQPLGRLARLRRRAGAASARTKSGEQLFHPSAANPK